MKKKYFLNANIVDPKNSINEIGGLIINEKGKIEAIGKKVKVGNIPSQEKFIDVKNDDLLAIRTTGAYSSVMKSNYNSRIDAVEVLIYNGRPYQMKEIETIQDIISKEKIIDFYQ